MVTQPMRVAADQKSRAEKESITRVCEKKKI